MELIQSLIVIALAWWGWNPAPAIVPYQSPDPIANDGVIGYATWIDESHTTCGIGVTDQWYAMGEPIGTIIHEVGHCLLMQYGFYGHFQWRGVMWDPRLWPYPTPEDREGLASYAGRPYYRQLVVNVTAQN